MSAPYYEMSFMIFRTGSILIVGKCNEEILRTIYRFICTILENEYSSIQMGDIPTPSGSSDLLHDGAIVQPKGVKNTRKKKINTVDIRFYNE